MEKILNKELMAIIPQYVDSRGNCTILYTLEKDPWIIEKSIRTVVKLIAKYYMIDLRETKQRYGPIVSTPNLVPIPLSKKDVFVPFKVRTPMYKNDGAFGYINIKHIDKISKTGKTSIVYLKDGMKIKCLCSLATVEKHMKNGNIVSRCYETRAMEVKEDQTVYNAKLIIMK